MANFTPVGVEAVIKNERGFMGGMNAMQGVITGFATAAATAAIQGVAQLTKAVANLAVGTVESAIQVESAFAGVIKTTDGLVDETGQLTEAGAELKGEFRDLANDVPMAVEELMAIGELGGQLGIAREDLLSFTEVITAMGVSTNLTTEEAATQFAQIANIMGTVEEEGDDAFSKLGSTIVALGNNFATTESDISAFAQRIAGAGEIAGLSEADVLGIGAAMSSVGVQAEAGGTAVQKVLLGINEAVLGGGEMLDVYAATAGLTTREFAKLWEEDAGAGFDAFVKGLGRSGDDALGILDALELKDQRLVRSFLSLANAGDLITESMGMASDAWEENTALAREAGQRYATMESQIAMVKNQIRDFGITIGEALMPFLTKALEIVRPFIQQIGERLPDFLNTYVVPALGRLMSFLGDQLPVAIQWLSDLWSNTLRPAISFVADLLTNQAGPAFNRVAEWVQANVLPVLSTLADWFQQMLPTAIDVVTTYWNSYLLPILASLKEQWDTKIGPALAELWSWLQERVPQAIQTAADFWETTLKPAMQTLGQWVSETLIPLLADIATWLIENIPKAIDTAAQFWEETLQPALNTVYEFIRDEVIPIIEDVIAWLQENIPTAIDEARRVWEEVLLPAITKVWDFIEQYLLPIFEGLVEMAQTTLLIAVELLAGVWEKTLKPALEGVWDFIDKYILPIFRTIVKDVGEDVTPILETLADFLNERLIKAFEGVRNAIQSAATWLGTLLDKVREWRRTDTPKDWKGQSPPPIATWLTEVGVAMANLSQRQIPALTGAMGSLGSVGMAAAPARAVTNHNAFTFQTTINSDMDAAVFQARTERTVEYALRTGL